MNQGCDRVQKGIRFKITVPAADNREYFVYAKDIIEAGKTFEANAPATARVEGKPLVYSCVEDKGDWKTKLQDGRAAPGA